jgi:hypothetical protein
MLAVFAAAVVGRRAGLGWPLGGAAFASLEDSLQLVFNVGETTAQLGVLGHQVDVLGAQCCVLCFEGGNAFQQLRATFHSERIVVATSGPAR